MMGVGQKVLAKKLMDSAALEHLTHILATLEHEQVAAAKAMEEALDIDHIQNVPEVEQREEALRSMFQALVTDSFGDVWAEDVLPTVVGKNAERAEQYIGMGAEEWQGQRERWAESYRESGAEGSTEEIVRHHIRTTFDVDAEVFRSRVVEFDAGQEAERLFAGNLKAVTNSMKLAREHATDGDTGRSPPLDVGAEEFRDVREQIEQEAANE